MESKNNKIKNENNDNKNDVIKGIKYKKELKCFGDNCCNKMQQDSIKYSNKIIIPDNILTELLCENVETPYFFRVINPKIEFGVVCGIHEATAPQGLCYIPNHIMDYLNLNEGCDVILELVKPKNGTYIKLQPHTMDFINMKNVDHKQLLESAMSMNYQF